MKVMLKIVASTYHKNNLGLVFEIVGGGGGGEGEGGHIVT